MTCHSLPQVYPGLEEQPLQRLNSQLHSLVTVFNAPPQRIGAAATLLVLILLPHQPGKE